MKKILAAVVMVMVMGTGAWAALPSVTMLSSETCAACEQMAKVLDEVKSQYSGRITTAHIILEENPDIAKKYDVRYVPTLIFRDASGETVAVKVGAMPLSQVLKVFRDAGVKI